MPYDDSISAYADAVEHNLRVIHMAVPAHASEGMPAGVMACRVCIDPTTGKREIWPCPTMRIARRLRRILDNERE